LGDKDLFPQFVHIVHNDYFFAHRPSGSFLVFVECHDDVREYVRITESCFYFVWIWAQRYGEAAKRMYHCWKIMYQIWNFCYKGTK
ncbi:hypothetical protein, partial [Selenomonas sp.]|uniref:hypothetical protein n=1 Tax=Selenomonas sp. TaxID=2053611 RepID=UPI0025F9C1BE